MISYRPLDDYILFGGYPGAANLREDKIRWKRYVRDAIMPLEEAFAVSAADLL